MKKADNSFARGPVSVTPVTVGAKINHGGSSGCYGGSVTGLLPITVRGVFYLKSLTGRGSGCYGLSNKRLFSLFAGSCYQGRNSYNTRHKGIKEKIKANCYSPVTVTNTLKLPSHLNYINLITPYCYRYRCRGGEKRGVFYEF